MSISRSLFKVSLTALLAMSVGSALAQTVEIETVTDLPGGTNTVPVDVSYTAAPGVVGFTAVVDYDQAALAFGSCDTFPAGGVTPTCNDDGNQVTINVLDLGLNDIVSFQPAVTINFNILPAFTQGTTNIVFGNGTVCSDNIGQPNNNCTFTPGSVSFAAVAEGIDLTPDAGLTDAAVDGTAVLPLATLTNTGQSAVRINTITPPTGFTVTGGGDCAALPFSLDAAGGANDACTLELTCDPAGDGNNVAGDLTVSGLANGVTAVSDAIPVSCTDPLPLVPTPQTDPTAVDFGNVPVDTTSAPRQVVVSNAVDGTDFQITAVGTTSDQVPNVFGFDVGTCINNITIGDTGGSDAANCAITVTCSPVAEGTAYTGNLNIGTTAGNLQVPLQCGGVVAAPVPIPTLSQYAMMLLAGLMVMGAAVTLRRSA